MSPRAHRRLRRVRDARRALRRARVASPAATRSLPGMLMAAARLNLPVGVPLRRSDPARQRYNGQALDIVSVFEAVGACAAGALTESELGQIERAPARPRAVRGHVHREHDGRRSARRSAWHSPGSASPAAVDRRRDDFAYESRRAVMRLLELISGPATIMTREAFENAIAVVMALGGSTNAVLHLLAIAHEAAGRRSSSTTSTASAPRVPHSPTSSRTAGTTCRPRPRRRRPVVMSMLLERRPLHGDCLTVTGTHGRREPRRRRPPAPDGDVVHPRPTRSTPRAASPSSAARSRPTGAVVKVAGIDHDALRGTGAGVRRRGRGDGRPCSAGDRPGRRRRHPLRGPQGRPRDARDARDHRAR
ncbi:MAG: hypothetical protein KatS3mg010_1038 [Acidimicrobiia bacterium]|nr:MAG: hypothetical protein KatS3mg010_1038 [Acidimicrobiia bacterium]